VEDVDWHQTIHSAFHPGYTIYQTTALRTGLLNKAPLLKTAIVHGPWTMV
jgi:hypothetical protein